MADTAAVGESGESGESDAAVRARAAAEATAAFLPRGRELKSSGYELFILLLSVLSVANFAITLLTFGTTTAQVAITIDAVLTPIFLGDFVYRLMTARSKSAYFFPGRGWADLVASMPMMRILRVFRVFRVIRLMRLYGLRAFLGDISTRRASATFFFTIFLVIVVVEFAAISVLWFEVPAGGNIRNAGDALWWGIVTITTVGYGDQVPVTGPGRIVGVFLLFAGIALFSVLTGFIANIFLAPRPIRTEAPAPGSVAEEMAVLHALLDEQDQRTATIRTRLVELEQRIPDERT